MAYLFLMNMKGLMLDLDQDAATKLYLYGLTYNLQASTLHMNSKRERVRIL